MKSLKTIFLLLVLTSAYIFNSCDDSGVQHSLGPKGLIELRPKNFKHIEPYSDGIYELWVRTDSLGNIRNYSLGRLNFNANGEVTDTNGGAIEFKFSGDTNSLAYASDAFITMEPPGDYNSEPSTSVLVSGIFTFTLDSIYTTMRINGRLALGNAGTELYKGDVGGYIISTPSNGSATCLKGVWFCDTSGSTLFPSGIQLFTSGWVYQGWLVDKNDPQDTVYYSTGRFTNPYSADWDGAGSCGGSLTPYNKPGQDWVGPPPCPQMPNINDGYHGVIITLEPSYEHGGLASFYKPSYLLIYSQYHISSTLGCYRRDNIFNNRNSFPEATLRITY
jgi:hypothetical protein